MILGCLVRRERGAHPEFRGMIEDRSLLLMTGECVEMDGAGSSTRTRPRLALFGRILPFGGSDHRLDVARLDLSLFEKPLQACNGTLLPGMLLRATILLAHDAVSLIIKVRPEPGAPASFETRLLRSPGSSDELEQASSAMSIQSDEQVTSPT